LRGLGRGFGRGLGGCGLGLGFGLGRVLLVVGELVHGLRRALGLHLALVEVRRLCRAPRVAQVAAAAAAARAVGVPARV
jgi:hypothetical protein